MASPFTHAPRAGARERHGGIVEHAIALSSLSPRDESDALDAVWRFESAHHFLLAKELAARHPAFVADWYAAMDETKATLDRQSERVLAVLHDKDRRIRELEGELELERAATHSQQHEETSTQQRLVSTREQGMQATPAVAARETQCDGQSERSHHQMETIQARVREQDEQIDVLMDELERLQAILNDATVPPCRAVLDQDGDAKVEKDVAEDAVCTTSRATQFDGELYAGQVGVLTAGHATEAIKALQAQLDRVEMDNAQLQAAVRGRDVQASEPLIVVDANDPSERAGDWQLEAAIQAMEMSTRCAVAPWIVCSDDNTNKLQCLDLEHQLQACQLERDMLADKLLAIRGSLFSDLSTRDRQGQDAESRTVDSQSHQHACAQITCTVALTRMLAHCQRCSTHSDRDTANAGKTKTLRRQIRAALSKRSERNYAAVIAEITREWAGWEERHLAELRLERARVQEVVATHIARIARLEDEVYRLDHMCVNLTAEMSAVKEMKTSRTQDSIAGKAVASIVKVNRRILALENMVHVKDEQLAISSRVVAALSSGTVSTLETSTWLDSLSVPEVPPAENDLRTTLTALTSQMQIMLQRQQSDQSSRSETAFDNVVQYFELEKTCLNLRRQLNDRDLRIAALEECCCVAERERRHAQQQVQRMKAVVASVSHEGEPRIDTVEPILFLSHYVRVLEALNSELWEQLSRSRKCTSRLEVAARCVDNARPQRNDDIQSHLTRLIGQMEKHHTHAVSCFVNAQNDGKFRRSSHDGAEPDPRTNANLHKILLTQYEDLCLQLEQITTSLTPATISRQFLQVHGVDVRGISDLILSDARLDNLKLVEKTHQLERRLLEVQVCKGCDKNIQPKEHAKCEKGISTSLRSLPMSTQTKSGLRTCSTQTAWPTTRAINVPLVETLHVAAFRDEASQLPTSDQASQSDFPEVNVHRPRRPATTMDEEEVSKILEELEQSIDQIAELTTENESLTGRLHESKKIHRKSTKDRDQLTLQLKDVSKRNEALLEQLLRAQKVSTILDRQSSHEAVENVDGLQHQLSIREQENLELVRQLCEIKEKCFQLEQARAELEMKVTNLNTSLHSCEQRKEQDEVISLDAYMSKVTNSLERIERDKETLSRQNEVLREELAQLKADKEAKDSKVTRSWSAQTDTKSELSQLRAMPEYQEMETRVVLLQTQLDAERKRSDELQCVRDNERSQSREYQDAQLEAARSENELVKTLVDKLQSAHDAMDQEFLEYREASLEAKAEVDKRLIFLNKCVEECVRLVDSSPSSERLTIRDIYDTIVSLSNNLVVQGARRVKRTSTGKKVKGNLSNPTMKPRALDQTLDSLQSQYQADSCKVRAVKLEELLRAAHLRNQTFGDVVTNMESQMDGLKLEIKDRMERESALIAKLGNLKVDVANLKSQCSTLTSRLTEACGELKRNQDCVKIRDGEFARLRTALKRKTDLLNQHKQKCDELQKTLSTRLQRISQLEGMEKSAAAMHQKHKDQSHINQELRQQCASYNENQIELLGQIEKDKEQISSLQTRAKALRQENNLLRDQVKELKKIRQQLTTQATVKHQAGTQESGDGTQTAHVLAKLTAVDAPAAGADQVKILRRRVLQKQEVILGYKSKVEALDRVIAEQRTKLFDLAQSNRQLHQTARDSEKSIIDSATSLKHELEATITSHAEQLDGLRASIFDSCELFVRSARPRVHGVCSDAFYGPLFPDSPKSSATASSRSNRQVDDYGSSDDYSTDGAVEIAMQELRRYTDFSSDDLEHLKIGGSKAARKRESTLRLMMKDEAVQLKSQKQVQQLLHVLEKALEHTPHDCRTEICEILEFISVDRHLASEPSSEPARRY